MLVEIDRNKKRLKQRENSFKYKNRLEVNHKNNIKNPKNKKKFKIKNSIKYNYVKHDYSKINSNSSFKKNSGININWPLEKGSFWISARYGIRKNKGRLEMHHGVDLAALSGTPVKSALAGKVIYAESRAGYGKCIILKHDNNIETRYAHLSKIYVKNGDIVLTGQKIGLVGATGNVRGKNDPSHLHFELIINGERYNPLLHII